MHIVCAYSISNSLGLSIDHFQPLYKCMYKSAQYTCSYYTYKYKYNTQMQEEQIRIQECISSVYLSTWNLSEGMEGQDHFTKMFLQKHEGNWATDSQLYMSVKPSTTLKDFLKTLFCFRHNEPSHTAESLSNMSRALNCFSKAFAVAHIVLPRTELDIKGIIFPI